MSPLPTQCLNPACQASEITYSVGVVPTGLVDVFQEYPVVRCTRCGQAYFTRLPRLHWQPCTVNPFVTGFTTDPAAIKPSLKLRVGEKLVGNAGMGFFTIYEVYPASPEWQTSSSSLPPLNPSEPLDAL